VDIDGMLDSIEPGLIDEWAAYNQVEPDKMERIITILKLGFALLCRCGLGGAEIDPECLDPQNPNKRKTTISPKEAANTVARWYGTKLQEEPL
jgi:hypothetical protein